MQKNLKKYGWLFLLPTAVAFLFAFAAPFVLGVGLSFTRFRTVTDAAWVGLQNYVQAFTADSGFLHALWFTALFSGVSILTVNVLAFALALLLTRGLRGTNFFRGVFFMPNLIGGIVLGYIWNLLINGVLAWAGVDITYQPAYGFWGLVALTNWQLIGYMMLIYIAALQNVPDDLLEAAAIDGASRTQTLFRIKLPLVMPAVTISLEHIKKTYEDGVTVIPDLNLEIRDREFLILVGPSGCGKSTTLRMIAGLEDISGGTLKIGDRVVNDLPPKDRDIAMVFQSYALYPHMTVYKNMAFGLQLRRVPKAEIDRKVRTAAQALELTAYLDRRPRALSGGQRQRVALGRAMVRDPAVFLLDEPLSNLDAKLRTEMRARIAELHRELGTTFVYVTHDQTEAMTMADRIVVMLDGKIQQADTPAQLYAHPCNVFVAGFIGTPPMNILPGRLVRRGNALDLQVLGTEVALPHRLQSHAKLLTYVDRDVLLGLRAEDLSTDPAWLNITDPAAFRVQVEMAERMGAETYLYADLQGRRVIARVPGTVSFQKEDQTVLYPNMEALHLFDPETEVCICD